MKEIIVIPTFNELENIKKLVSHIFKLLPEVSILVVDDNSPDGTAKAVLELCQKFSNLSLFSRPRKEGLGRAYVAGFEKVLANPATEKIIMMDADFSHDPEHLSAMIRASEHHSVVLGSRYISGGKTKGWKLWRRILSRCGNLYCRTITGMPIYDCTTGFMIVDLDFLKKVDLSKIDLDGFAFLMELKYLLWKTGSSFKEIPIVFSDRVVGKSKISNHIIREGALAPWKMVIKNAFKKF